ncbi:hypothetical protein [uncultured Winogradskyella sp.]|uniref:hypothetical protein n=1 Tax=uncultured Winogradskyella sp. TaxID=395353 RepID=UPI0026220392|nr:hypothetical protein [uncultured Winogradskyella sp.]
MGANTIAYKLQKITCEDDSCQKEFSVIISPIYTAVTRPVSEIKIKAFARGEEVESEDIINDYIVVNCPCGKNTQRVYLKKS